MMKLDPGVAKRILDTEDGKHLAAFLAEAILSLDTVRDIKSKNPVEVAVEVEARSVASQKLEEILGELIMGRDATRPTAQDSDYKM